QKTFAGRSRSNREHARMAAKFAVGIDLGTTNTVVAFTPLDGDTADVQLLPLPQVVAASTIESRSSLPSFLLLAREDQARDDALKLPWHDHGPNYAVGEFARRQSADNPDRTVSAAKS